MIVPTVIFCCQVKEDTDLYIIDEIGKMELYSSSFFPAVTKILESNVPVLASVPLSKFGRDVPGGILMVILIQIFSFNSCWFFSCGSLVCALLIALCTTYLSPLCVPYYYLHMWKLVLSSFTSALCFHLEGI